MSTIPVRHPEIGQDTVRRGLRATAALAVAAAAVVGVTTITGDDRPAPPPATTTTTATAPTDAELLEKFVQLGYIPAAAIDRDAVELARLQSQGLVPTGDEADVARTEGLVQKGLVPAEALDPAP